MQADAKEDMYITFMPHSVWAYHQCGSYWCSAYHFKTVQDSVFHTKCVDIVISCVLCSPSMLGQLAPSLLTISTLALFICPALTSPRKVIPPLGTIESRVPVLAYSSTAFVLLWNWHALFLSVFETFFNISLNMLLLPNTIIFWLLILHTHYIVA